MKQLPSLTELRAWMTANPDATRRDIARAFGIKGAAKIDLKAMLRELEGRGRCPRVAGPLAGHCRRSRCWRCLAPTPMATCSPARLSGAGRVPPRALYCWPQRILARATACWPNARRCAALITTIRPRSSARSARTRSVFLAFFPHRGRGWARHALSTRVPTATGWSARMM